MFDLTSFSLSFIRVAIVDDHKSVADGFEHLINRSDNMRVVGKAYNVAGCLEMLEAIAVDVALLDVSLTDGNGIDLCATIKKQYPQVKVLMLTSYGEMFTINRAFKAGADGYVLKSSMSEEIVEGILTVAEGKQYRCKEVAAICKKRDSKRIEFTRRELELLKLIAEGYTLPEQADRMCLGQNTIRTYRQQLSIKLDAHNTVQLVQNAKDLMLL